MINILHTIDTTGPGGAETVFLQLIRNLDHKQFKPVVVIRGKGYVNDQLHAMGIEPYIINAKGSFNLKYLLTLIAIIRQHKISLIQSHLLGSNVYCSLAGLITRIPVVSVMHGLVDFDRESYKRIKFWLINLGSKKIVFVSNHLKKLTTDVFKFSKKKTVTIYNGVDIVQYNKASVKEFEFIDKEKFILGCVGNIRRPKGYDVLVRAIALVNNPDISVIVIGDKKYDLLNKLTEKMKELDVEKQINFIGFRNDVAAILQSFDLFVLPSTSEGFSISTIEAMASGIPVIVTKSGGPQEIVTDNVDGLLVEINSPEKLALAITRLINDKQLRDNLVKNARKTVSERFSIQVNVAQYVNLYQALL